MKDVSSIAGGFAGAAALTIVHQIMKNKVEDAPRMDKIGMEATAKLFRKVNLQPPSDKNLFLLSLAGDLISNSIFYSKISTANKKQIWLNGAMLGLTAGLSAVYLPGKMGLNQSHSSRSTRTQLLTVGLYVFGGLVAAATASLLQSKKKKAPTLRRYAGM